MTALLSVALLLAACAAPVEPRHGQVNEPATPPAVRAPGQPRPIATATGNLEQREHQRVVRLAKEGAACESLCEALRHQLAAKRTSCAMAAVCSDAAIGRLVASDEAVRQRGCSCPVPPADLTEQAR